MTRTRCRACGRPTLHLVLDLGTQPPSNALVSHPQDVEELFPLRLVDCEICGLLQLDYDVPHEKLFNAEYPLYSGQVPGTVARSAEYARRMTERLYLTPGSFVVEIGGNDGTLLRQFNTQRLNVEASSGPAQASVQSGIPTTHQRWGTKMWLPKGADLIIANNVMAHDPNLRGFVQGIAENLAPGGTFTAEFPWALSMIQQTQFDTIYHEHYSYFTLGPLIELFREFKLTIYDVEDLSALHGGTLRIYAAKSPVPFRNSSVRDALERETALDAEAMFGFKIRVELLQEAFVAFTEEVGPIFAYGAAAKGSTFLNSLDMRSGNVAAVADSSPAKIGKFMPGVGIPIVSEAVLAAARPAYVLILPWNWADQIADKLHFIRGWGGQFVTAIPALKVF